MVLSICIPTYNREQYLRELLPTLLEEMDAVATDAVELVVSNNLSTDGTESYLKTIDRRYFRFWTNETNIGGDRNFLKCIREARGEYVWLLGDDDLIAPDGVARVLDLVARRHPDLLISGSGTSGVIEYADYRDFLEKRCRRQFHAALAHTLISANVFRRECFDLAFAEAKLYTQYAHMFGLMVHLTGKVMEAAAFVGTRPVRADFAKYPSFLCVKQAIYLWFLAKRFSVSRFRLFALRCVCNLPMEFGSRIKNFILKSGGRK